MMYAWLRFAYYLRKSINHSKYPINGCHGYDCLCIPLTHAQFEMHSEHGTASQDKVNARKHIEDSKISKKQGTEALGQFDCDAIYCLLKHSRYFNRKIFQTGILCWKMLEKYFTTAL